MGGGRGLVPALPPCDEIGLLWIQPRGDAGGQRDFLVQRLALLRVCGLVIPRDAVADRRIDIAVGVALEQCPHRILALEGRFHLRLHGVEEKREDGVLPDVLGDVLLGVVGPHLLLVDVLLEDVAEDVRVDLLVIAQGTLIEVPLVAVEVVEDGLEGLVGNLDVPAVAALGFGALQFVDIEDAAVEIGHATEELFDGGGALDRAQSVVEEFDKEVAVEAVELVLALLILDAVQPVPQIVPVPIEEALPLDEIEEHQPVEHHGGIPFVVPLIRNAGDEFDEGGMLLAEFFVEPLGDPLVHVAPGPACHIEEGKVLLVIQRNEKRVQLLKDHLPGLPLAPECLPNPQRLARFPPDPLPDLDGLRAVREDDQVLMGGFGSLPLEPAAESGVGEFSASRCRTVPDHEAPLVGDGREIKGLSGDGHREFGGVPVPPEFLGEQSGEVGFLQAFASGFAVKGHSLKIGRFWLAAPEGRA